jgi:hypothetical protein
MGHKSSQIILIVTVDSAYDIFDLIDLHIFCSLKKQPVPAELCPSVFVAGGGQESFPAPSGALPPPQYVQRHIYN